MKIEIKHGERSKIQKCRSCDSVSFTVRDDGLELAQGKTWQVYSAICENGHPNKFRYDSSAVVTVTD